MQLQVFFAKNLLTQLFIQCEMIFLLLFLISLLFVTMVPIDTPRKRTRFLVIPLMILTLSVGTASAATKTAVKTSVKKATSSTAHTTTAKSSTKKTSTKKSKVILSKSKSKTTKKVKAAAISARTVSIITNQVNNGLAANDDAASAEIALWAGTQTPSVSTLMVTNPVNTDSYFITVTPPSSTQYSVPAANVRGYYAQPIAGKLSQGLHDVNAVDMSAPKGSTVQAAANGIVIVAMDNGGYNGGYGNYIVILHPNGTQTLYAHLSQVTTTLGAMVHQGEPIALSGNTGESTGPHLHFEVRGATNPWANDILGTTYTI
ncbi:MAG: peptidase family protein [Candidatus Nomurabacteria bacterium]|nr:peptidase family protein [Candidatus Nomurabacteria bacterium]